MANPKLVRIRRNKLGIIQDCDVYIGRSNNQGGWNLSQSKWANPYTIKQYGSVAKVCELYFNYIVHSDLFQDLPELDGKTIGCWCDFNNNGFYCHGSILIELFKLVKYHNLDTKFVQSVLQKAFPKNI